MKTVVWARTAAFAALAAAAMPAAATVTDPAGDFLASYTGVQAADVDIRSVDVRFDGTSFILDAELGGDFGATPNSLLAWGINRGAGTARLASGTPPLGQDVLFDSLAVIFGTGSALRVLIPPMGPPQATALLNAVEIDGARVRATLALADYPSRGFDPDEYVFTLWSRVRLDPARDSGNFEIADFGPSLEARDVPEPAGLGVIALLLAGLTARRRARAASGRVG